MQTHATNVISNSTIFKVKSTLIQQNQGKENIFLIQYDNCAFCWAHEPKHNRILSFQRKAEKNRLFDYTVTIILHSFHMTSGLLPWILFEESVFCPSNLVQQWSAVDVFCKRKPKLEYLWWNALCSHILLMSCTSLFEHQLLIQTEDVFSQAS